MMAKSMMDGKNSLSFLITFYEVGHTTLMREGGSPEEAEPLYMGEQSLKEGYGILKAPISPQPHESSSGTSTG